MDYSTNPVNRALKRLMEKHKLTDAEAHRRLGIYTPAAIGNYRRGAREVPTDLIQKWEKVFGEKLLEEAKEVKMTVDTNVSHETKTQNTRVIDPEVWFAELKKSNEKHEDANEFLREEIRFLRSHITDLTGKLIGTHKA